MTDRSKLLDDSLCFQLYVASKEIIRLYKPYLDSYQLTYTAFIAMIAIEDGMSVKRLGELLYLDSGTLSPLLKKLETNGYIQRVRSQEDERLLILTLTPEGQGLKQELPKIGSAVYESVAEKIDEVDMPQLHHLLLLLNKQLN